MLQKITMCHGVKLKNERSTAGFRFKFKWALQGDKSRIIHRILTYLVGCIKSELAVNGLKGMITKLVE